jgi:hypothetical protein
MVTAIALSACASYRALPLDPPSPGGSPLALRYERTRFHLFTSTRDDAQIETVFASGATIVAAVSQPGSGVFVSSDSGIGWVFTSLDDPLRDVMIDGALIVARGAARIHCSADAGKSWQHWGETKTPIDAAVASGGAVYAASGNHLHVSHDCARSWDTLTPQIPGAWRARSIAVDGPSIYLSVRGIRETAPLTTLLDGTSDAAVAALSIADGRETRWAGPDGIWVTHDGGALWQKSSLPLDAWLAVLGREVWAVAADPMIEGAALVRRAPALAAALDGQLRGARPDATALRASLRFPGRDELLRDLAAPIFRSADEGGTWVRMDRAPAALRISLERQRAAQPPFESVPQMEPSRRPATAADPAGGGSRRGRGRRGERGRDAQGQAPQRSARAISSDKFFVLLDPVRLLARFNSGRPLTGIAGDGILYAYAPTQEFWDSLADAAAAASDSEGEIATDLAAPARPGATTPSFALLSSTDGGATWSSLPSARLAVEPGERAIFPYPIGIAGADAQALVVFGATVRGGQPWREAWREVRE